MEFSTLFSNSPLNAPNFFCKPSSNLTPNHSKVLSPKRRLFAHKRQLVSPKSPRRRRNTLREKLPIIPNQHQVSPIPQSSSPPQDCEQFDDSDHGLDTSFVIESAQPVEIARKEQFLGKFVKIEFIILVCGFFVVRDVVKFLFAKNGNKVDLGKKEALGKKEMEMLRRKKEARIRKEGLMKGSVLVVGDVGKEVPLVVTARPELDNGELMKVVRQSEELGEGLVVSGSNRSLSDFDGKVKEIREMARDVERGNDVEVFAETENGKVGRESSKDFVDIVQDGEDMEISSINGGTTARNMGDCKSETEEFSKEITSATPENGKVGRENSKNCVDTVQDGKVLIINGDTVGRSVYDYKREGGGRLAKEVTNATTLTQLDVSVNEVIKKQEILSIDSVEKESDRNSSGTSPEKIPKIIKSVNKATLIQQHASLNEEVKKDEVASIDLVEKESDRKPSGTSPTKVPKIIKSVKKAREYLKEKHGMSEKHSRVATRTPKLGSSVADKVVEKKEALLGSNADNSYSGTTTEKDLNVDETSIGDQSRSNSKDAFEGLNDSPDKSQLGPKTQVRTVGDGLPLSNIKSKEPKVTVETKLVDSPQLTLSARNASKKPLLKKKASKKSLSKKNVSKNVSSDKLEINGDASVESNTKPLNFAGSKNWLEENFQEFNPTIEKIARGFRDNFNTAKENVQESVVTAEISELASLGDNEELEWMKDEKLREIVFQVRDNELTGRDPFHLMDSADQQAFFKGLELKAEKVNEKILRLHEWVHSRIENLDYGADGISLDDPVEKIFPRWKGPAFDKDMEFLQKSTDHQMTNVTGNMGLSPDTKSPVLNILKKSEEKTPKRSSSTAKTLIECSDGSKRPGKKTGKEHWQHTKKWSQDFLEVYNAETDPEIKSIMKDIGKDLDRWITEEEIQDVAALRSRIPRRQRRYIERKMEKLKREVATYGAPAVVSKYKEYADEKKQDYLWWLDLQYVLCIELYTEEDGKQKIGFYSLEMAADLELDPKQYHVIAFEDPGDSKSFCYIVQAHMDTLGSGKAFVVARPPKDAFREAKGNGFQVTVIKKGEIKFDIDQPLEEAEEQITEIGSKIYHDKIMKERGADTRTLMKGLIRADKARKSLGR